MRQSVFSQCSRPLSKRGNSGSLSARFNYSSSHGRDACDPYGSECVLLRFTHAPVITISLEEKRGRKQKTKGNDVYTPPFAYNSKLSSKSFHTTAMPVSSCPTKTWRYATAVMPTNVNPTTGIACTSTMYAVMCGGVKWGSCGKSAIQASIDHVYVDRALNAKLCASASTAQVLLLQYSGAKYSLQYWLRQIDYNMVLSQPTCSNAPPDSDLFLTNLPGAISVTTF